MKSRAELIEIYRDALQKCSSKVNSIICTFRLNFVFLFQSNFVVYECLNDLFQIKTSSRRDPWIRQLTPLLIVRLKQSKNSEEINRIFKIFKLLLLIVDSHCRKFSFDVVSFFFIPFISRHSIGFINHSNFKALHDKHNERERFTNRHEFGSFSD